MRADDVFGGRRQRGGDDRADRGGRAGVGDADAIDRLGADVLEPRGLNLDLQQGPADHDLLVPLGMEPAFAAGINVDGEVSGCRALSSMSMVFFWPAATVPNWCVAGCGGDRRPAALRRRPAKS